MKSRNSIVLQVLYVLFACATIWRPLYGSSLLSDFVFVAWSLYMFGTGFIDLANDVNSKKEPNRSLRWIAMTRMILAVFFSSVSLWFFVQVILEDWN